MLGSRVHENPACDNIICWKKKPKKHQHPAIIFHILDIFPKALIQDLFLSQYDLGGKTESQEQMCVCFFLLMKGFPIVLNYLICHHLWFLYSKRRNIITTTCIICRLLFWSFINFFVVALIIIIFKIRLILKNQS